MSTPQEQLRLLRGKTHVETVYLTLLDQTLARNLSWDKFLELFAYYVYRSFILPLIIRDSSGERERMFIIYLRRACEKILGDKSEFCPDFESVRGDPYTICIQELSDPEKLKQLGYTPQDIRERRAYADVQHICREIVFQASMALLIDLKMIS